MTALIKFEDLDIAALTVIAAEQYEECLWAIEKALEKQLAFGRLLLIVKEKLPHGEWGTWVRETFADHKSLRTIQRYMRGAVSIATDPSLLDCADSLDGILKIVEDRKPVVEVTETAASVPDVAEYIADSDTTEEVLGIAPENAAVETVKPEASKPSSPTTATTVKTDPTRKAPTVIQVNHTLMRLGKDKKRHDQLMQIASDALDYLAEKERFDWLSCQLLKLSPDDRSKVYEDVDQRQQELTDN